MYYPDLSRAPKRVRDKAASFGVHHECAMSPQISCRNCRHLVKMAFDAYYGHIDNQESLVVQLNNDLRAEARKT